MSSRPLSRDPEDTRDQNFLDSRFRGNDRKRGLRKILKSQKHRGDPREDDSDVALDDLIVALWIEFIPRDFFLAAGAGV